MGAASSRGDIHWRPLPGARGVCLVARVHHVPGMPVGAALVLARWVQQGTSSYAHAAALQDALRDHGATLTHVVCPAYTQFTLRAADWQWGARMMQEMLHTPLLETDTWEDLNLMWLEEWRAKPLDDWLAQQLGWCAPQRVKSAAELRGIWRVTYAASQMELWVGGNLPPASTKGLLRSLACVEPRLSSPHHEKPWSSSTYPPLLATSSPVHRLPHSGSGGASSSSSSRQLVLVYAFPSTISEEAQTIVAFALERYLQRKCRDCRSWARHAQCTWYAHPGALCLCVALQHATAAGRRQAPERTACTTEDDHGTASYTRAVSDWAATLDDVTRAQRALYSRLVVQQDSLDACTQPQARQDPRDASQMHGIVRALSHSYLRQSMPRVTVLRA